MFDKIKTPRSSGSEEIGRSRTTRLHSRRQDWIFHLGWVEQIPFAAALDGRGRLWRTEVRRDKKEQIRLYYGLRSTVCESRKRYPDCQKWGFRNTQAVGAAAKAWLALLKDCLADRFCGKPSFGIIKNHDRQFVRFCPIWFIMGRHCGSIRHSIY